MIQFIFCCAIYAGLLFFFFRFLAPADYFAPINLLMVYSFSLPLVFFFFLFGDFSASEYFIRFGQVQDELLQQAVLQNFLGLIGVILGYAMFSRKKEFFLSLSKRSSISTFALKLITTLFLVFGIGNFFFLVFQNAHGDLILYFQTVAFRNLMEQEVSQTTIFYNFSYIATFFIIFGVLRDRWSKWWLLGGIMVNMALIFSNGGKPGPAVLAAWLPIAVMFTCQGRPWIRRHGYLIVPSVIVTFFLGLMFYSYRTVSFSLFNENKAGVWEIFNFLISPQGMQNLFIDKGSLPIIPVQLKIFQEWGTGNEEYLLGKSLVLPFCRFLPAFLRPDNYQISVLIKDRNWFPSALGAHPPTGIGELYANFGPLGPFLGFWSLGAVLGIFHAVLLKKQSFWLLVGYYEISIRFVFFLLKNEFDNLPVHNLFFLAFGYFFLRIVSKIIRNNWHSRARAIFDDS